MAGLVSIHRGPHLHKLCSCFRHHAAFAILQEGVVNVRSEDDYDCERVLEEYDQRHAEEVLAMKADPQVYQKLAKSLCPSIFGHDSIKQAVLLQVRSGCSRI